MYDWEQTQRYETFSDRLNDTLIRTGDITAAFHAAAGADDADWELTEGLNFNEPFDPFADDPE